MFSELIYQFRYNLGLLIDLHGRIVKYHIICPFPNHHDIK